MPMDVVIECDLCGTQRRFGNEHEAVAVAWHRQEYAEKVEWYCPECCNEYYQADDQEGWDELCRVGANNVEPTAAKVIGGGRS